MTRNAALGVLRSESRRTAREGRIESPVSTDDPFKEVAAREAAHGVRAALDELSPEQRTVITFAYFGAMTLPQIAQRTGAPLGTVKRRAQLGLSRLARALGPQTP